MDINIDYFEQLWEEAFKEDHKADSRTSWDNRAEEFNRNDPDERIGKISALLLEKQMLQKGSTVLDIGCGPGKFVLAFAPRAKSVAGVDISPKMLQYATENAAALGLDNTEFRELDWRNADLAALNWRKKFSLVTGIMSPALSNPNSLEKMIEASNEYCLLCHFVERQDSIMDVLRKVILGWNTDDEFGNKALYCSLNILWLKKLFPEIVYFDTEREITRPLERAGKHYITKLEMNTTLTAAQKSDVLDFLKNTAENGMIRETITARIACIYWRN
ncbi:MAG: methyltransferase domain-containing protein [Bacillota bacterium]|nr:methyltransferase domain-containing protein [Bacillota bacterium]